MMDVWLILPIIIPLITAAVAMVLKNAPLTQRGLGVLGTALMVITSFVLLSRVIQDGIQVSEMGNWAAPFGIVLVADLLSIIMVVINSVMGFAVAVYSVANIDRQREAFSYYPLYLILLMGVNGSFLTGDLFNMYVWFEVLLIASFVLLSLGNEKKQTDGAVKYVVINLVSSAFFLAAIALLYGMTGTLNMADLAVKLNEVDQPGLVTTVAMLFMICFGIKAALFPLFFWLPASYHTPPVAISAIFAGLLTKVGVYALIRVFTLLFTQDVGYTHTILLWVSGLTMLTGVLGAAAQYEVRRILSFHIISQIGYMIMGLALFTPLGLVGAVFYIVHHIIVKTNLFLVAGVTNRIGGSFELKHIGGFYKAYPMLAILFLIPAFSLAGFPPLSGFWAKFTLIRAGLEVGEYTIVGVALLVGLLTMFSMTKIWTMGFWEPAPPEQVALQQDTTFALGMTRDVRIMMIPIVLLALLTMMIGLWTAPFFEISLQAAEQLLDPQIYIQAVLKQ